MVPRSVFLDPELTLPTPGWLWASSGIRSLDHAVEAVYSPNHQSYVDTLALEAIRLLFQNLKLSTGDPADLKSRLRCQLAAWMSFAGVVSVGTGLSHSIGRVIGATWNIPHGITSCLTLSEVMRMEAKRNPERLALIARAEGKNTEGVHVDKVALEAADGVADDAPLAEASPEFLVARILQARQTEAFRADDTEHHQSRGFPGARRWH